MKDVKVGRVSRTRRSSKLTTLVSTVLMWVEVVEVDRCYRWFNDATVGVTCACSCGSRRTVRTTLNCTCGRLKAFAALRYGREARNVEYNGPGEG